MKIIFSVLILLITTNIFGQNKSSLLRDGNKLYSDSLYYESELKYRKSLEKDQDYFKASFNLADAIYKQNRFQESSAIFKALKDKTSDKDMLANIYHNLGNSLLNENKVDEAIAAYKNALRIKPTDQDTRHNLMVAYQKQQDQDQEKQQDRDKISKEDAKKMLEAIEQQEKKLQEKMKKKKVKGSKNKILKDW